ncbi:MAG: 2OG-Fe(II) oxygenase [Terriglobales bacterium]
MYSPQTAEKSAPFFDYSRWNSELPGLSKQYAVNKPLPHILIRGFLDAGIANAMAEEFPSTQSQAWIQYKHPNERKLGLVRREVFPTTLGEIVDELNSPKFVSWLSQLTGIPDLIADSSLDGGGLHQSTQGGFLNLHTDFSHHHHHKNWKRRINLILYLNPGWQAGWGGDIEFWDAGMQNCMVKYPPILNHALIFNTDERFFHGFPEPVKCPEGESRKSLALYYYTLEKDAKNAPRSTNYRSRPEDGISKSALIWLDKQAVDLYSRAKARFGFSDDFASKILGLISGKR